MSKEYQDMSTCDTTDPNFLEVSWQLFKTWLKNAQEKNERVKMTCPMRDDLVYKNGRCFLYKDGSAGICVTEDNEAVNLFNVGPTGRGKDAMNLAIKMGACMLSCPVDLIKYYAGFGFTVEDVIMVKYNAE